MLTLILLLTSVALRKREEANINNPKRVHTDLRSKCTLLGDASELLHSSVS